MHYTNIISEHVRTTAMGDIAAGESAVHAHRCGLRKVTTHVTTRRSWLVPTSTRHGMIIIRQRARSLSLARCCRRS